MADIDYHFNSASACKIGKHGIEGGGGGGGGGSITYIDNSTGEPGGKIRNIIIDDGILTEDGTLTITTLLDVMVNNVLKGATRKLNFNSNSVDGNNTVNKKTDITVVPRYQP